MDTPERLRDLVADARTAIDPLLDDRHAAEYLATTPRHVRELRTHHEIAFVKVGRLPRVRRSELDRYLAARTVPANA